MHDDRPEGLRTNMAAKTLFTPGESTTLLMAAYNLQSDKDAENFLAKVERILLDKMYDSAENERLLGLSPKSS